MTGEVNVSVSVPEDDDEIEIDDGWRPDETAVPLEPPLEPGKLAQEIASLATRAVKGSPNNLSHEPTTVEPNATVHEILWALYLAIEKQDAALLKALREPAAEYLRTHPYDGSGRVDIIATKREFTAELNARVTWILSLDPGRRPDDIDSEQEGWAYTDIGALCEAVSRGARAFPQITALEEKEPYGKALYAALVKEFGEEPFDRSLAAVDIAERAIRAVGVSAKEAWNLLHAADRMRQGRARKRGRDGEGGS